MADNVSALNDANPAMRLVKPIDGFDSSPQTLALTAFNSPRTEFDRGRHVAQPDALRNIGTRCDFAMSSGKPPPMHEFMQAVHHSVTHIVHKYPPSGR